MMKIDDFIGMVEEIAPLETQEQWDNSGYQIKLTNGEISKVMVALEITTQVVYDAIINNVDLILTHHPLIFGKIQKVDNNDVTGKLIIELIRHGISVYSTHTPFDKCTGGNNDYLGEVLGLKDISSMETDLSGFCKVGFVEGEGKPVGEFIEEAARALKLNKKYLNYCGYTDAIVKKCGWCSGAGAEFIEAASKAGCDLYITGDVKHHAACQAKELELNVLDCGHFGTEQIFCQNICEQLKGKLDNSQEIDIIQCDVNLNPFTIF